MDYYRKSFDALPFFQTEITPQLVDRFISCCVYFETRDQHAAALNSPLIGVIPIFFTTADQVMLYSTMNIEVDALTEIISKSEYTEPTWVVSNDPYNNTIIYLIYRIFNSSKLTEKKKAEGTFALMKLLHYKYFTSLIHNSYPYGADEATMSWVINNLNNKFGLAKLESWKRVIEERCEYLLSPECKQHYKTLRDYRDDVGIIYVLSDTQSNIRQKVVRINVLYYDAKERNEAIGQYRTLDTLDGTKIITSTRDVLDVMNTGMQLQIQSPTRLLDMELIEVVTSKYNEVSTEMFRMLLEGFCNDNVMQLQDTKMKSVVYITNEKTGEKEPVYTRCSKIVEEFLQKTWRYCIQAGVDMSSSSAILVKTANIYTSSQLTDTDILQIKRSLLYYVANTGLSRRQATISALSFCLTMYLIIRSFDYIR